MSQDGLRAALRSRRRRCSGLVGSCHPQKQDSEGPDLYETCGNAPNGSVASLQENTPR